MPYIRSSTGKIGKFGGGYRRKVYIYIYIYIYIYSNSDWAQTGTGDKASRLLMVNKSEISRLKLGRYVDIDMGRGFSSRGSGQLQVNVV